MDPRVEFTLRLVRIAQEALQPRSSLVDWVLFPDGRRATWDELGARLVAARKPVLVVAPLEPGCVAFWSIDDLASDAQRALEHEVANSRQFFAASLAALGLTPSGCVETADGNFRMDVSAFREWTAEFCLGTVGVSLAKTSDDTARAVVRLPGGGGPPIGWIPPTS